MDNLSKFAYLNPMRSRTARGQYPKFGTEMERLGAKLTILGSPVFLVKNLLKSLFVERFKATGMKSRQT